MDFIDDFILEYKNNPCLWKADSAHFKNRTKRQEAYMKLIEVAAKHGEHYNVERTKQKINNLRCAFRHQLKKYTESKIKGEKEELYCPKRKYFESLLFLRDEETAEKNKKTDTTRSPKSDDKIDTQLETSGGNGVPEIKIIYDKNKPDIISVQNLNEECENSEGLVQNSLNAIVTLATSKDALNASSIIEYEEVNADSAGERDIVEHHISEYEKESSFEQQKPNRRRKRSISMSSQQSMDTELNSTSKLLKVDVSGSDFEKLLSIACSNNQKISEDSFSNFGQFVAHKLRSMEPTQAMYAEKIINDVLFQGQVKLLTVLSVNQFGNFVCNQSPENNQTDK